MPRQKRPDIGRRSRNSIHARNTRIKQNTSDEVLRKRFVERMKSLSYVSCAKCKKTELIKYEENYRCYSCKYGKSIKFTSANHMDPGMVPPELLNLSKIEQMLIARVQPVLCVYQLKFAGQPGNYRYKGNIINVEQDITEVARVLPKSPKNLDVVIIRKKSVTGYVDFRVRRKKVLDALRFLKDNNPFYSDIEIDNDIIASLPEDDFVTDQLPHLNDNSASEIIEESDHVIETCVPILPEQRDSDLASVILNWPSANRNPINEFTSESYIVHAFPHLFPTGEGTFLDNRRNPTDRPTFKQWVYYLMHFHDRRFAQDSRFRFFVLNRDQRHDAINSSKIFAKKTDFNGSVDQLVQEINHRPNLLNKLLSFGAKIRGSTSYWFKRRLELQSMVEQLGVPTIFLTLSSADFWFPDLSNILNIDVTQFRNDHQLSRYMQKLLIDNPMIADEFFSKRVKCYMDILKEKLKIKDFWYRFEWQHRGAPHIHMVAWLEGAPDVASFDVAGPDEIQRYIDYYDSIVTAVNPNVNAIPSEKHPSREWCTDIDFNDDEKTAQLLNRVQRHTKHSQHCLRKRGVQEICRFNFPKRNMQISTLEKNEKQIWTFTPKRNDELLDEHNRFVSHSWRANTDCKVVTSQQMIINYLSKYAAKGEPHSNTYKEMITEIASSLSKNAPARTVFTKLLNKIVGNRDYSACEVHHLLNGDPLYHCSRQFVKIFIGNNEYIQLSASDNQNTQSILETYKNRPLQYENITLFEFASSFKIIRSRLLSLQKKNVVQVVPYVSLGKNETTDEIYFKQKLLLHSNFRLEQDVKTHCSWKETYENSGLNVWNLQGTPDEEPDDYEYEGDIDQQDWMEISLAHPEVPITETEIGFRTFDRDYNWYHAYGQYPKIDEVIDFVKQSKNAEEMNDIKHGQEEITFNLDQRNVLDHFICQLNGETNQKRTIVCGSAGVGKSCVIREMIRLCKDRHGDDSVLLLAPTGIAANNIEGETIHSALRFHLNRSGELRELSGESRKSFQDMMLNVKAVICDEFSMVGQRMLAAMDKRLRQGSPEQSNEPFGGYIMYLFGDPNQLQPVKDRALYMEAGASELAIHGRAMFMTFDKVFELQIIMRQSGDEQNSFKNVLNNIANGVVTNEDYNFLEKSFTWTNRAKLQSYKNALRIISTNSEIDTYNQEKLKNTGNPVTIITAINNNNTSSIAEADECQGLPNTLKLCVGCRVILRKNLWTTKGLCNGSLGTVHEIIYENSDSMNHLEEMPVCVLVHFDNYKGPTIFNDVIPVTPVTVSFKKNGVSCIRKQIPLQLAFAISVHRSQGITVDKCVVDIGKTEFSLGLTYVALSRVRQINGLLLESFPQSRLMSINSHRLFPIKRAEFCRLRKLK